MGDEKNYTVEELTRRVNELYHKSQGEGLTEDEKEEQARLRQMYVANVRRNLRGQLNNISIVEKDGSVTNLGEKFGKKKEKEQGQESVEKERKQEAERASEVDIKEEKKN